MDKELIAQDEIYLHVDIKCTGCGKLMAYSNAFQYKSQYLCGDCAPSLNSLLKLCGQEVNDG